jgi:hypothetical protein
MASAAKMAQMKFEQDKQLEDQKQLGKAGNEAFRSAIEKSTAPELLEGQPGSQGFGSTTAL